MSTPPPYPQQPQYPGYQFPPPRRRNKALPWLVGGAVVVIAALVVTLVLVLSGDDDGTSTASTGGEYDLSSPEKAAESIAAAAKAGDVDEFLKLTCVGTPQCIEEQGEDATQQDIDDMRERITQGLDEFADQLDGATFRDAIETSMPGVMEVPYATPDMVQGEERGMTFVQVDGKWLWFGSSSGNSGAGGGGGAGSEGGAGHPGDASVEPDPHEPTTEESTVSCPPTAPDTDGNPFPTQPPIEGC